MSLMNIAEGLTFDDVLLIPRYSEIASRSEVSLAVNLREGFRFELPFVPSNMKTISELDMVKLMYKNKSLGIFHRFASIDTQLYWLDQVKEWGEDVLSYVGFSVGVKDEDFTNVRRLVDSGAKIIVLDIAHGNSRNGIKMTEYISTEFPEVLLIAGNVAEADGANRLWRAGADVVKVGIGGGSICTTRINAANGVPSFTSISNCYDAKLKLQTELGRSIYLMYDGGLHSPGCLGKALCFADLCMVGNLFSATDEAPGEMLEINEVKYKSYVGSSTHRGAHTEGVEGLKKYKGSAAQVIKELSEGIKSCCSYQGVNNLYDLKIEPRFVKITNAGIRESKAHDLDVVIR